MLDGHTSSTPNNAEGEMVGTDSRRKFNNTSDALHKNGMSKSNDILQHTVAESISLATPAWITTKTDPKSNFTKRERRHVYHDIVPLKSDIRRDEKDNVGATCNKILEEGCSSQTQVSYNSGYEVKHAKSVKPAIPPKPKYILRDKRQRHVYQTIDLMSNNPQKIPPPLPNKPFRLHQARDVEPPPPPLPPRVVNEEAVKQRHKLDQEYFANLRKSVDEHLLELAEDNDLPVPIQSNVRLDHTPGTRRFNYGAHSPPLNFNDIEPTFDISTRRHSLPLYESIQDIDSHTAAEPPDRPPLPARILPNENNSETYDNITSPELSLGEDIGTTNIPHAKLAQNLLLLKRCGWYWGNMTWQEAEALLEKKEGEGAFLMRDSQNPLHLLTITVRSTTNTIHHIRVEYCEGKFQLYEPGRTVSRSAAQCVRHSNVEQFIKLAVKHSISGSFLYFLKPKNMGEPPVQIRLLTPISRLANVKSLKYLCRMTIRNCVVKELIPSIPLPMRIQQYLMSGPYYDSDEDI